MKISARALLGAAAAASLVIGLAGCSSNSTPAATSTDSGTWAKTSGTIVFGVTPDQAGSDSNSKPLEDYIAKQTGYKVEYYNTPDYTALIAALVAGKVDVGSMGGLQYVIALNKGAKIKPVAATLTSPNVTDAGYYSEAIVPTGSSITSLSQAKGKTVCFVDPNSTSGFLFGLYQLSKAGLSVTATGTDASGAPTFADFTAKFAGSHDKSEQAIAARQCDMGFAEDTVADAGAAKGEVKVIGKEYVSGGPLTISTVLPADVQTKLTTVLQGATLDAIKSSGVTMTDGFNSGYFGVQKVDASYYKTIVDLCSQIPAAKCAPTS
jgi:phosphonate transport system substrate-binding protein